ncbi:sigma-70 family RNA polymerase sigma factor [Oscillatoria amoena NRMC-F 0135]|nr:MAG: sigma-70 family RNA polymerase sigma factor [Bacteroidota bacterium]MDL5049691.1 sigma-70 family RNA polymerase sigma factor [Oscillatoria amoena NRMC-F 0135]
MTVREEEIVAGCLKGDPKYQKALYSQYSKKMYGVCLRYASDPEAARDLLQDGFIKVFQNLAGFKGQGSFEGWIRRIMVNNALEMLRKLSSKAQHVDVEDVQEELYESTNFSRYDMNYLLSKIQQLAPGYRAVFNLYVIEGFQHNEIAEMLGISENTSKSQLSRARKLLQESLEDVKKAYNV